MSDEEDKKKKRKRACDNCPIGHMFGVLLVAVNCALLLVVLIVGSPQKGPFVTTALCPTKSIAAHSHSTSGWKLDRLTFISVNGTELGTSPGKIYHFGSIGWCIEQEMEAENKHNECVMPTNQLANPIIQYVNLIRS